LHFIAAPATLLRMLAYAYSIVWWIVSVHSVRTAGAGVETRRLTEEERRPRPRHDAPHADVAVHARRDEQEVLVHVPVHDRDGVQARVAEDGVAAVLRESAARS
jgi:hypothetical protein